VAVAWGQFGKPGRGMSALGSRYKEQVRDSRLGRLSECVVNCRLCELAIAPYIMNSKQ
jgi:hypothetical protein